MNRQRAESFRVKTPSLVHRPVLQRACACGQHAGGGECEECRKKKQGLQRQRANGTEPAGVPAIVDEVLRSAGQPLESQTRRFMESRFGRDFSRVRVHEGARAATSARAVDASAYTVGDSIVFGAGQYSPATQEGRELLAHELTHVVQQTNTPHAGTYRLTIGAVGDRFEHEADTAARTVAGGERLGSSINAGPLRVRRQPTRAQSLPTAPTYRVTPTPVEYGWALTQNNTDGSASTIYKSVVAIKFTPDPALVRCDEIAFVQNVRLIEPTTKTSKDTRQNFKERLTKSGWTIDRLDKKKYGWYGYNNDGKPKGGMVTPGRSPKPLVVAELTDEPKWDVPDLVWDFETCAICKAGSDAAKVYSCLTWGFDADSNYKLKSHPTSRLPAPSAEFSEAVKQWNAQAKKPETQRNDPDQQPLGPFK